MAVLDRSFCNEKWLDFFKNVKQRVLVSSMSDHAQLLIASDDIPKPRNIPFRLHSFWMENESFISVVEDAWRGQFGGDRIFILASKLKRVKGMLRPWVRSTFPNLNDELKKVRLVLKEVQDMIEVAGMKNKLFNKEANAKIALLKASQLHDKLWAEKAILGWIKDGDCNSKFCHLSVKLRRAKNQITTLRKEDCSWISDQSDIASYISQFYQRLHEASEIVVHSDLLESIPKVLEEDDVVDLEAAPSRDEIMLAVWDMDPPSSPDPDGFPGSFFRKCWPIVEDDFCRAVKKIFEAGQLPKGINNFFISFIPKVKEASSLDRFRPICMGNFFCKVLTKIMASRLQVLLPRLISDEQGAFHKGKIISANISMAFELSNMMHSVVRGGGMGLKLDVQKAFDSLSWDFLFTTLKKFSFSTSWISWVHQILVSSRVFVLVNGGPVGFFEVGCGLR
ncbi:uncharacterized protein LOC122066406 [Macadamia integrifolia]|uniref:uncharacterized protein LOC122066406 n=1 Tax=Macadamia integrifolia TaxID=60698 RepID=UPI001C4F5B9E|nr:uncharacterized protein LOC122066406 [Macadamia integrifolia]